MEPFVVGLESVAIGAGDARRGSLEPSTWSRLILFEDGFFLAVKGDVAPYLLGNGAGDCRGSAEGRGVLMRLAARVTAFTRFLPAR